MQLKKPNEILPIVITKNIQKIKQRLSSDERDNWNAFHTRTSNGLTRVGVIKNAIRLKTSHTNKRYFYIYTHTYSNVFGIYRYTKIQQRLIAKSSWYGLFFLFFFCFFFLQAANCVSVTIVVLLCCWYDVYVLTKQMYTCCIQ